MNGLRAKSPTAAPNYLEPSAEVISIIFERFSYASFFFSIFFPIKKRVTNEFKINKTKWGKRIINSLFFFWFCFRFRCIEANKVKEIFNDKMKRIKKMINVMRLWTKSKVRICVLQINQKKNERKTTIQSNGPTNRPTD